MLRPRPADGHKGTFGHALLVTGSEGMAGAAILCAEACLRSGAGKLTVRTPEANRVILQVAVPEAILLCDDGFAKDASTPLPHFEAVGIGPGIGKEERACHTLDVLLRTCQSPMVLDADALNILAARPEWQALLPPHTILTPHPGEAMRLIGSTDVEDVSAYAQRHQVCVVLKGHPTHVCTPDGQVYCLPVGNSGMATAGSGDVLTGLVTGLLAQGYAPRHASLLGVWLHATAGDFAAQRLGEECMLARDIVRHLPEAFGQFKVHS